MRQNVVLWQALHSLSAAIYKKQETSNRECGKVWGCSNFFSASSSFLTIPLHFSHASSRSFWLGLWLCCYNSGKKCKLNLSLRGLCNALLLLLFHFHTVLWEIIVLVMNHSVEWEKNKINWVMFVNGYFKLYAASSSKNHQATSKWVYF